jgi:hypothetical protein
MGGEGISGLLGHADRRALIGLKSLYYWSKYFKLASLAPRSCVSCGPRRFYGRISFTVANWFRLR